MCKVLKWLILFMGVVFIVACSDSREEKTPIGIMQKVKRVDNKNESLFKEVTSLAKLEFFKMDAIVNKKILMVYFYSDNCYYCEKMKKQTFTDFRVQEELAENYSAIRINYSKYKKIFKLKFPLRATPAIFIFDKEGNEIKDESFYGYQGAEDFYHKLELLAEPF